VLRVVADLGNSRLKWGRVDDTGRLVEAIALPLNEPRAWATAWEKWSQSGSSPSYWSISTVNPPVANQLQSFLDGLGEAQATWFRSAADVAVQHELDGPETAGADRALAVAAAVRLSPRGRPILVVSCGTAITVERISEQGIWQGGAIAAGLGVAARALHSQTALLPLVELHEAPPCWGASTRPAIEAGVFWGTVGAVRELLARQTAELGQDPWVIWTGGYAALLSGPIAGTEARVEPDLVLLGLCGAIPSSHD
jgi:type III pantothenate kinase